MICPDYRSVHKAIQGEKFDRFIAQVVDFSASQTRAFIEAYVEIVGGDVSSSTARARELIKGCREHYRASVTRISRNLNIIPFEHSSEFVMLAKSLLEAPEAEYIKNCATIALRWPKCKRWLRWWCTPSHAGMLFKSQQKTDNDIETSMPDTTNAIESLHQVYYKIADKANDLVTGLTLLLLLSKTHEAWFKDLSVGLTVRYGKAERWKTAIEEYGSKRRKRGPQAAFISDGRPPDSTVSLLNAKNDPDKLPHASPISDVRMSESTFVNPALESHSKSDEPASAVPRSRKRGPGRPKGSTNKIKHPLITYQSYVYNNNTCYIDSLAECLFHCWMEVSRLNFSPTSKGWDIFAEHFAIRRACWLGEDDASLKHCLSEGQEQFLKWIVSIEVNI